MSYLMRKLLSGASTHGKSLTNSSVRTATTGSTRRRLLSTSKSGPPPPPFQLPEPTWSVQDLELSKQHPPISNEELQKLAKRALLDLDQLDASTREELRQDLGNMMHMIEKVQSFQHTEESELSDQDIYDKPRGVTAAPLRKDSMAADNTENTTRDNSGQSNDEQKMVKEVWESFLKPKTTKVGAHDYFSIETKRE